MTGSKTAALVLSGGGAKGAFEVGAEKVLREEFGYTWDRVFGVSVGALNATLIGQGQQDVLKRLWDTITEADIYEKFSTLGIAWRLVVRRKLGAHDNRPTRATLQKYAAGHAFVIPVHVGRVSLRSGQYELVSSTNLPESDFLDAVWNSATMPIMWEPAGASAWVDGGLRNITPLGDALNFNPTEIIVILANPRVIEPPGGLSNVLDVAVRSLTEITMNEVFNNDLDQFVNINDLVQQAGSQGVKLMHKSGRAYRYVPITIIAPQVQLGDTLDFSREMLTKRYSLGVETARAVMAQQVA